jgi:uncharacterized protein YnzC (UPF0291/DUF896 family)
MSAIVTTLTPFFEQNLLLEALDVLEVKYKILNNNTIETERVDYYGNQSFVWQGNQYTYKHDSSANRESYGYKHLNIKQWKTVAAFLQAVESEYINAYQRQQNRIAQAERERQEAIRQAYVQQQKQAITAKAKALGYSVKENIIDNKVQLVLIRNVR